MHFELALLVLSRGLEKGARMWWALQSSRMYLNNKIGLAY